jgi:hypothetical protein
MTGNCLSLSQPAPDLDDVGDGALAERLAACELAGVKPRFEETTFRDDDDVRRFVQDRGAERRNLTKGQKAIGHAMHFPDPEKGVKGKQSKIVSEFSDAIGASRGHAKNLLAQARRVVNAPNKQLQIDVREGIKTLDEAFAKVVAEEKEQESDVSKFNRLREQAPDLATLVDEGKIALADAASAHQGRLQARWRGAGLC